MLTKPVFYLIALALLSCAVDSENQRGIPSNIQDEEDPVTIIAQVNSPPSVINLSVTQDVGNGRLIFEYDLNDKEEDSIEISIQLITDGQVVYEIPLVHLEGDVGYPVMPGNGKSGFWNYANDTQYANLKGTSIQLQVKADDRFVQGLEDVIGLVERDRIKNDLRLMEGIRHTSTNTSKLVFTREYIRDHFVEYGLEQTDQHFNHLGTEGINIIGTIHGTKYPNEYYIIDGHYDTIISSPGADDNASGTAGMLEAMRVLSQFNFERGIKFIGFDLEEVGLRGSRYYAGNKEDHEQIKGMINFEMIGYTCKSDPECEGFRLADSSIYVIQNSFSREMMNEFLSIGENYVPGLGIETATDDGDPNYRRSDHAPFWDIGVDALFVTDGANFRNPHYHKGSDTFETLDTKFAAQIVQVAVGTIAKLAGYSHTGTVISNELLLN